MNDSMESRSLPADDVVWGNTLHALSANSLFSSITSDDFDSTVVAKMDHLDVSSGTASEDRRGLRHTLQQTHLSRHGCKHSDYVAHNNTAMDGSRSTLPCVQRATIQHSGDTDSPNDIPTQPAVPETVNAAEKEILHLSLPPSIHASSRANHHQTAAEPPTESRQSAATQPCAQISSATQPIRIIEDFLSDCNLTQKLPQVATDVHTTKPHIQTSGLLIVRNSPLTHSIISPLSTNSMKLSQELDSTPNTSKSIHSDAKLKHLTLFSQQGSNNEDCNTPSDSRSSSNLNSQLEDSQLEDPYKLPPAKKSPSAASSVSISPNTMRKSSRSSLFSNNTIQFQNKNPTYNHTNPRENKSQNRESLNVPGKGLFYIANSPSPPHEDKETTNQFITNNSPNAQFERHDSLFSNYRSNIDRTSKKSLIENTENYQTGGNKHVDDGDDDYDYTSTDISEDDDYEDYSSDEDNPNPDRSNRRKLSDKNDDNESEWMSVSSDDDDRSDLKDTEFHPLQFKKIQPRANTDVGTSTSTIPISVPPSQKRNSTPSLQKPRSLLSGLFLNELPNAKQPPSLSKPILKRSSTTGIITIEQSRINPSTKHFKRPSILFSKKHNSFTDIAKNYPHYQNNLVKENILNDSERETDILGKQRSIVGISEYNVITKNTIGKVGDHEKENETIVFTSSSYNETLSSSLNKYSDMVSVSNTSFKSLLSKSSINLTKIYNNSMSRFNKSDMSFSEKSSTGSTINNNTGAKNKPKNFEVKAKESPKLESPHSLSDPISTPIQNTGADILQSNQKPKFTLSPKTTRKTMLSTELSESLKESIIIDYKLGKVPLPSKVINDSELLGDPIAGDIEATGYDDYHSKGW